jgi:hypothetical protein
MLIEQLLELGRVELEAITDEQMDAYLKKYYCVTRPEQVAVRSDYNRPKVITKLDANALKGIEALKQMGLGSLGAFALANARKKR